MIDLLPIVLRVHTERTQKPGKQERTFFRSAGPRWGDFVLVIDTETLTDKAQALTFGSARLCWWNSGTLDCDREYLFHADDLPTRDPEGYLALQNYAWEHRDENRLVLLS